LSASLLFCFQHLTKSRKSSNFSHEERNGEQDHLEKGKLFPLNGALAARLMPRLSVHQVSKGLVLPGLHLGSKTLRQTLPASALVCGLRPHWWIVGGIVGGESE